MADLHTLEVAWRDGRLHAELDGRPLALARTHPCLRVEFGDGAPEVFLHLVCNELALDLEGVDVDELRADGVELVRRTMTIRRDADRGVPPTPFTPPDGDEEGDDGAHG